MVVLLQAAWRLALVPARRLPNGTAEAIDARDLAPAAANETMYVGRPSASLAGGLAVAVPLELQGLWLAHQRHGLLPWEQLLQPAIEMADRGFPAHPYLGAGWAAPAFLPSLTCVMQHAAAKRNVVSGGRNLHPILHPRPHAVAALSGENQTARLAEWPAVRDTFLIRERGKVRLLHCQLPTPPAVCSLACHQPAHAACSNPSCLRHTCAAVAATSRE